MNTRFITILLSGVVVLSTTFVHAELKTFIPGESAIAQEVNENFEFLLSEIQILKDNLASANEKITALQDELDTLKENSVLELDGFLKYQEEDGRDTVWIEGANLQVVNGTGFTQMTNGLGNIIIGYNEYYPIIDNNNGQCSDPQYFTDDTCEGVWGQPDRIGSHNLITGVENGHSSYGSIVAGQGNYTLGNFASILGGARNAVTGSQAVVSGGEYNIAIGENSSITGGGTNKTIAPGSNISGGYKNTVGNVFDIQLGKYGSILGGEGNNIMGDMAVITGGKGNNANGEHSVVVGGSDIYVGLVPNMSGNKSVVCGKNSTNSDNKISCDSN